MCVSMWYEEHINADQRIKELDSYLRNDPKWNIFWRYFNIILHSVPYILSSEECKLCHTFLKRNKIDIYSDNFNKQHFINCFNQDFIVPQYIIDNIIYPHDQYKIPNSLSLKQRIKQLINKIF